jgi:hypothetical protein
MVKVHYPLLDINEIQHAFDGDPTTVIRSLEANPLRLILAFDDPIPVHQAKLLIGGTPTRITLTTTSENGNTQIGTKQVGSDIVKREITFDLKPPVTVKQLELEILNTHDGEIAHVHLWEVSIE